MVARRSCEGITSPGANGNGISDRALLVKVGVAGGDSDSGRQAGPGSGTFANRSAADQTVPMWRRLSESPMDVTETQRDRSPSPDKWVGRPVGAGCRASLRAAHGRMVGCGHSQTGSIT